MRRVEDGEERVGEVGVDWELRLLDLGSCSSVGMLLQGFLESGIKLSRTSARVVGLGVEDKGRE